MTVQEKKKLNIPEEIEIDLNRLRLENAYLKKLNALVCSKKKPVMRKKFK